MFIGVFDAFSLVFCSSTHGLRSTYGLLSSVGDVACQGSTEFIAQEIDPSVRSLDNMNIILENAVKGIPILR